jgi:hypothetical protein
MNTPANNQNDDGFPSAEPDKDRPVFDQPLADVFDQCLSLPLALSHHECLRLCFASSLRMGCRVA